MYVKEWYNDETGTPLILPTYIKLSLDRFSVLLYIFKGVPFAESTL